MSSSNYDNTQRHVSMISVVELLKHYRCFVHAYFCSWLPERDQKNLSQEVVYNSDPNDEQKFGRKVRMGKNNDI